MSPKQLVRHALRQWPQMGPLQFWQPKSRPIGLILNPVMYSHTSAGGDPPSGRWNTSTDLSGADPPQVCDGPTCVQKTHRAGAKQRKTCHHNFYPAATAATIAAAALSTLRNKETVPTKE